MKASSKLSKILMEMTSPDIAFAILKIIAKSNKDKKDKNPILQEAISILENSKTEQEALQKIQEAFAE